jgi:hypothetical protein
MGKHGANSQEISHTGTCEHLASDSPLIGADAVSISLEHPLALPFRVIDGANLSSGNGTPRASTTVRAPISPNINTSYPHGPKLRRGPSPSGMLRQIRSARTFTSNLFGVAPSRQSARAAFPLTFASPLVAQTLSYPLGRLLTGKGCIWILWTCEPSQVQHIWPHGGPALPVLPSPCPTPRPIPIPNRPSESESK